MLTCDFGKPHYTPVQFLFVRCCGRGTRRSDFFGPFYFRNRLGSFTIKFIHTLLRDRFEKEYHVDPPPSQEEPLTVQPGCIRIDASRLCSSGKNVLYGHMYS